MLMQEWMISQLKERENKGELRSLKNGRETSSQLPLIDFSSNDYLGLARSPALKEGAEHFLQKWQELQKFIPNGSTGSRLLTGNHPWIEEMELFLADSLKAEAALIFNSGYTLNVGLFSCLLSSGDILLYDEQIHASIREGARLSGCHRYSFRHNDLNHLEKRLKNLNKGIKPIIVAVESLYSMDGDFAPLQEMVELCERYGALVIVDEAHTTGIIGERGEGLVVSLNLEKRVFARIHTFGKALGSHGAVVLGSKTLMNFLINYCRSLIYTTALPPIDYATMGAAIRMVREEAGTLQNQLRKNIAFFHQQMDLSANFHPFSPIIPLRFPAESLKQLEANLLKHGFQVHGIFSPTVQRGKERLRMGLHSFNTEREISAFMELVK